MALVAASAADVAVVGRGGGRAGVVRGASDIASCWFALAAAAQAGVGRRFDAADRRMPRDCGTADRAEWLVGRGVVEVLPEAARVEEVLAFEPMQSGPSDGAAVSKRERGG